MTETIAPAAPLATFLKGAGVPREHQAAASTAVLMWLEQLGPNTAAATLLHTAEALKQVQDHNAELLTAVAEAKTETAQIRARFAALSETFLFRRDAITSHSDRGRSARSTWEHAAHSLRSTLGGER